jgi:hypothetical protein
MNRFDGLIINAIGEAVPGCLVYVCNQPVTSSLNPIAVPPTPLATLYTDASGATILPNPVTADGNGNFFFYAPVGVYSLIYSDPYNRIQPNPQIFPDQQIVTPGGGSTNSVGLSAPTGFSVSGSPVTISGVLALAYSSDWPNGTVIAGPLSGGPGLPTRRQLTAADITGGGLGTVTSVNAAVTPGALFVALFSGGPVTSSGVLALAFDFAPQLPNLILAGPASGGLGAVTARLMQPADLPVAAQPSFSATPVFNGANNNAFIMTLSGNVTSSTFSNGVIGQLYTFVIKQDGTGGRVFTWPANVKGQGTIDPTAGIANIQQFIWDGTNLLSVNPMQSVS